MRRTLVGVAVVICVLALPGLPLSTIDTQDEPEQVETFASVEMEAFSYGSAQDWTQAQSDQWVAEQERLRQDRLAVATAAVALKEAAVVESAVIAEAAAAIEAQAAVEAAVAAEAAAEAEVEVVVAEEVVDEVVEEASPVDEPHEHPVEAAGSAAAPEEAPAPSGDVWERLARCESGMTNANTGNGFYGYFQFVPSTWRGVGGSGLPTDHGYGEQVHRAQILQERAGWNQWPSCSRQLGLR